MKKADIDKHGRCYTCQHSFATRLLENQYDIRTLQGLPGHRTFGQLKFIRTFCK